MVMMIAPGRKKAAVKPQVPAGAAASAPTATA
jgi:hypothetical protein